MLEKFITDTDKNITMVREFKDTLEQLPISSTKITDAET
jgi:hypothetical protein